MALPTLGDAGLSWAVWILDMGLLSQLCVWSLPPLPQLCFPLRTSLPSSELPFLLPGGPEHKLLCCFGPGRTHGNVGHLTEVCVSGEEAAGHIPEPTGGALACHFAFEQEGLPVVSRGP